MIFVTVGTHEQGFERLIKEVDELRKNNEIDEDVFMQIGYCDYKPKYCDYKKMLTVEEMNKKMEEARIIITHGGPGSIMLPFQINKVPIMVPRMKMFNEHVDDHQVKFTKKLESNKKVIPVYDISMLKTKIENYNQAVMDLKINYCNTTENFVKQFEKICNDLWK